MLNKVKLGKLIKVHSGDGISVEKLLDYGKYPVYGGNGINGYNSDYNVPSDTLIIGRVGEKCGNANITSVDSWVSDNALVVKPLVEYNNHYLKYLLEYIDLNSFANKNAQPVISGKIIYDIDVEYEQDIKCQQRIVTLLSDVDNLIDNLRTLIEKKVNIRNGIIYKIFNEKNNWKKIELKHVLQYEQPSKYIVFNTDYVNSGIPVLTAGKSFILGYTNENTGIYNKGKCILFDDFTTDIKKVDFKFKVKSSAVKMLTPVNDNYDLDFLYYAMSNINYVPVTHNRHWISIYSKFEIFIPNTLEEQKKISSILINADNEIEALKEKLSKYQKIKDGMMEDLLTGKVRLNYE